MAFPTTSVLDTYDRADNASLGANWTNAIFTGDLSARIVSNQKGGNSDTADNYNSAYWNVSTFGPNCEIYETISVEGFGGTFGGGREFMARLTGLDGTPSGYSTFGNGNGDSTWGIYRYDNGVATLLGATITQAIVDGDAVGIEVNGSTITLYFKAAAGSWTSLGTRTDSTYTGAGNIGAILQQSGAAARADNFGGGTIVTTSVTPPPLVMSPQRR